VVGVKTKNSLIHANVSEWEEHDMFCTKASKN